MTKKKGGGRRNRNSLHLTIIPERKESREWRPFPSLLILGYKKNWVAEEHERRRKGRKEDYPVPSYLWTTPKEKGEKGIGRRSTLLIVSKRIAFLPPVSLEGKKGGRDADSLFLGGTNRSHDTEKRAPERNLLVCFLEEASGISSSKRRAWCIRPRNSPSEGKKERKNVSLTKVAQKERKRRILVPGLRKG